MPTLTPAMTRHLTESRLLALRGQAIATQDADRLAVIDAELDAR